MSIHNGSQATYQYNTIDAWVSQFLNNTFTDNGYDKDEVKQFYYKGKLVDCITFPGLNPYQTMYDVTCYLMKQKYIDTHYKKEPVKFVKYKLFDQMELSDFIATS